ncbi:MULTISPECIES: family 43 glycosylhydrolase [unclassified Novosphingobium]|uniref:glycoside hydrolase family 43 protein n=1 Tax=unclassified Novosphingobium TaxID=2644732 RepID=UPI00146E77CE|nr:MULTISPECIES: family 43 glycosylhydrolase [unclassified Novosphingobium]NMN03547.1 GH43 family beta-xylosidase [Novosphingobium sp. SG919]NMN86463.1 GH43 family beta-xylosidase [Novosphingobium sp. SG916]
MGRTPVLSRRAFALGAAGLSMASPMAAHAAIRGIGRGTGRGNASALPAPRNPLVRQRADAQVFRHGDGHYYMMGSVPEYDRLAIRRAPTLAGLADPASEHVVWRRPANGKLGGYIWAPELHWFDGAWHIYFAAGDSDDPFHIRTYVLTSRDADPLTGTWHLLGQFKGPWDSFTLDSTLFVHKGVRYVCWAQREPGIETNSNLYLAPLADALTPARAPVRLSVPTLDWEIPGFKVNEAPAVLARNGRLFLTYSAAATDARYCLGMLTADTDADLMDPRAWAKSQHPVFTSCPQTSVYGPGHNSFTVDEHGHDMLVYHGRDYAAITGDPLFDPNRHTRVQRLYYHADGTPDFGVPVGNGALPDRLVPAGAPGRFLLHGDGGVAVGTAPLAQTQFRQVPLPALLNELAPGTAPLPGQAGAVCLMPILRPHAALAVARDGSATLVELAPGQAVPPTALFHAVALPQGKWRFDSLAVPGQALAAQGQALRLAPRHARICLWTLN